MLKVKNQEVAERYFDNWIQQLREVIELNIERFLDDRLPWSINEDSSDMLSYLPTRDNFAFEDEAAEDEADEDIQNLFNEFISEVLEQVRNMKVSFDIQETTRFNAIKDRFVKLYSSFKPCQE